jgi:bifunctional DNA-binding transcriptional regulator/antitoxin component of YhaV-PrlF toxin-antitoxin module
METQVTLKVAENGTLTIPAEILQKVHAKPRQPVVVKVVEDHLTVEMSEHERLAQISEFLHEILEGVTWPEIKEGRRDR